MKRSLRNLTGYTVQAVDGPKGKVKDFLFGEDTWILRYLEADYGKLVEHGQVLIPRIFLKDPDWETKNFPIDLSSKLIESCPGLDERKPVSREYESVLSKHYKIEPYWPVSYPGSAVMGMVYPPRPVKIRLDNEIDEKNLDTNLRSFREVYGYNVRALDGELGKIHDLVVDDEDWQLVYVVIDTSKILPWSKKVILGIDWLNEISYARQSVSVGLASDTIKDAPEYDERHPLEIDYEKALFDFYNRAFTK